MSLHHTAAKVLLAFGFLAVLQSHTAQDELDVVFENLEVEKGRWGSWKNDPRVSDEIHEHAGFLNAAERIQKTILQDLIESLWRNTPETHIYTF